MKKFALAAALALLAGPAWADCTTETAKDDLTGEEISALYDCMKEKLQTGYASGDVPFAKDYASWKPAATRPAAPGPHGNRFLMTFVNETGFDEYVSFSEEREGKPMPTGSVLAKESFTLKKGTAKAGPLFLMEKVASGTADEFGNWVYSAAQPSGKTMKISQKFCHDCHQAFEAQDAMGYPDEDVRVGG